MSLRSPVPARRSALVILLATATFALTACVDAPRAPVLGETPTPTPTPEVTTPPPVVPDADALVLDLDCGDLVDADAVYAFNPNLALIGDFAPTAGSQAAAALAAGGVACRWVLESGGAGMDVSVARLTEERLSEFKNDAFATSQMVPTYGDEAYFEVENGLGTAIVFEGDLWLVVTSEMFAEPGEPTDIVESALASAAAAG